MNIQQTNVTWTTRVLCFFLSLLFSAADARSAQPKPRFDSQKRCLELCDDAGQAWLVDGITGCKFFTGDDSIAGHYIKDGVVEDCVVNSSCNGVRLIGPAQGLSFSRCKFFGPGRFEHRTPDNLHRTNMLAAIMLQPSAWTPTPGPLEDVHISDVTIQNVACALHVSIREGNTADRLTVEKLTAKDVYSSAVSLESWTEVLIGEVTLRQIEIAYSPDAVIAPRLGKKPVVQDPIRKPGVGVWARKLLVWGLSI